MYWRQPCMGIRHGLGKVIIGWSNIKALMYFVTWCFDVTNLDKQVWRWMTGLCFSCIIITNRQVWDFCELSVTLVQKSVNWLWFYCKDLWIACDISTKVCKLHLTWQMYHKSLYDLYISDFILCVLWVYRSSISKTGHQGKRDQLAIQAKGTNYAMRTKWKVDYNEKRNQLSIKTKWPNWQSGQKGQTDKQGKKDKLTNRAKRLTDKQGKKDQVTIKAKKTNWQSGQKGPSDNQGKKDQVTIRAERTNWQSGQKGPSNNQNKEN